MTNLEGRVILRRRQQPPPTGVRTDAQVLKALADRLGEGERFSADPAFLFEELRRASAGGTADYAGISYARIAARTASSGPARRRTIPARPAVPGALRHSRRPRPLPCRPAPSAGRGARRRLSRSTSPRAGCCCTTSPARRPAASPELAEAEPEPLRRDPPADGAQFRRAPGRTGPAADPARNSAPPGAPQPRHPAGYAVRAVPLGRHGMRQPPHQRRGRSDLEDPGVQGLRGADREGRRRHDPSFTFSIGEEPMDLHPAFHPGRLRLRRRGAGQAAPARRPRSTTGSPATSARSSIYFRAGNSADAADQPRADARRQADAELPDRRQGRDARPAGRGRGPDAGDQASSFWWRPRSASPGRWCSISA